MSWQDADPRLRDVCERVLTEKELAAVKLLNAGYGTRRIANVLGVDRSTIRDRLASAERKITAAINHGEG